MKKFFLLLALSALSISEISAENISWTDRPYTGKPLTQWSFSKDKTNWEEVTVPHSYNNIDGQSKSYYRGWAYYKTLLPAASGKGARYLIFEGVGQSAYVIADGSTVVFSRTTSRHKMINSSIRSVVGICRSWIIIIGRTTAHCTPILGIAICPRPGQRSIGL